ncbi:DsbA family protein [Aspergillus undulatus]|uniref:DsbA family protein n=1 Tax=Aspergillus undulatus TaxID=1810928 RepID=UPI003CCE3BCB
MALAPRFAGQRLTSFYLDYVCPFSAKLFKTFYTAARPIIAERYQLRPQVIFRQHIQPWHPSSTLTHEAGAAILKIAPHKFWEFSAALFERQVEFFDVNVVNETQSVGVNRKDILELLIVAEKPDENGQLNTGNKVTNDIKLMIKASRVIGVHVSPTVFFDGIEESGISSSFTAAQWEQWLTKNAI